METTIVQERSPINAGVVGCGAVGQGVAWPGRARRGMARRGRAGLGWAWQGEARTTAHVIGTVPLRRGWAESRRRHGTAQG
jgi:hypothetical protein